MLLSTFGNLYPPLAALISAPILAHSLGVDGRGEVAAGTAPLLLAMSLFSLALPETITYFIARSLHTTKSVLGRGLALLTCFGILGTIGIVLSAPILSGGEQGLVPLIYVGAAGLVPSMILGGLRGAAGGRQAWFLISVERLVGATVRLGAIVFLALTGELTPLSATVVITVTSFCGVVVYAFLPASLRRSAGHTYSPVPPGMLRYGLSMWAGSLTGILLSRVDQTLMTPLSSSAQLGLYVVAVSVSEVVLVFNGAVRDVMFSVESANQDDHRLGSASRISTAVTLLAALAVALVSYWGVPILFGQEFAASVPVIVILLVGIVVGNPGSIAGSGLSARGRPGLRSAALAIALTINVMAIVFLVPAYGAAGAAYATLVGNLFSGGLVIVALRVFFKIPAKTFLGIRGADIKTFRDQVMKILRRH